MAAPKSYRATIRQRLLDLREVRDCLRDLDEDQPDAVGRALARYLTVRAVGYIEAVRDDLADLYASTNGHPRLHRRVTHNLRTGQGVAPEQILSFVGSFDAAWRGSLEALLDADDQDLRGKLGAMVAARKKIAHGDGEQVTTSRALAWAATAETIGKHLTSLFAPSDHAQV